MASEQLDRGEQQEVRKKTAPRAVVIHEAVLRQGRHELGRPSRALAWSGLAGGLSITLSMMTEALLRAHLPNEPWTVLVAKLGYPAGFLFVILGRQQLFTENTLTAILPLLHHKNWQTFRNVARLWAVVFTANMVGAHLAAWFLGNTDVMEPKVKHALLQIGEHAAAPDFGTTVLKGIVAGWLIALVVWLKAAVKTAEFVAIAVPTYIVGLGSFSHAIVGSAEVLFLVMTGNMHWLDFVTGFMTPTLIGNSIGGVVLTAALNHAQVVAGKAESEDGEEE